MGTVNDFILFYTLTALVLGIGLGFSIAVLWVMRWVSR